LGKRARQKQFDFGTPWGGRRKGAGRKPKGERALVSHDSREEFVDLPLHLTFHLIEGLPNLRNKREHATLIEVFARCREREGFRITQYSIQGNHVHLIVEARRKEDLTRGVTGLATSMARRLNKLWNRHGRVFADRFHSRVLKSPTEVLHALRYVFHNARNHGIWLWDDRPDPYSSGEFFEGWEDYRGTDWLPSCLAAARTWLLRIGWRRAGPVRLSYG